MRKKLNCIMLIDDDEPTNFIHKIVVNRADCTEKIIDFQTGYDALEYLKSTENGEHPQPDLILLDINMPGMNGWEFVEEYEKLNEAQKGGVVLLMLTTSLNPDDAEKAESLSTVNGFHNKPLTQESIDDIFQRFFSE